MRDSQSEMSSIPFLQRCCLIGGVIDSEVACQMIQHNIDRLKICAEKGLMEFNLDNCEEMHFGKSNVRGKVYS